jgi:hypothetical protein|tara:strand:+ start:1327 stop:2244 length:918 start_codon:yes stop_codon:yes gene_type:complete
MKNFVVKTKQVKKGSRGLSNRANYVVDMNAESHTHTVAREIRSFRKAQYYIEKNIQLRQEDRRKQGLRGGGIQNYATEFSFNLPPNKKLSRQDWEDFTKRFVKEAAKANGLNPNSLYSVTGAVVHNEEGGKNNHMHLILGNVVDKTPCKGITQRHTTELAKTVFTQFLKERLGLDPRVYRPKNYNINRNEPLWQARKINKEREEKLNQETIEISKETKKLFSKFEKQFEKLEIAITEQDKKQENRQRNRLEKTIAEYSDLRSRDESQANEMKAMVERLDAKKKQAHEPVRKPPTPFDGLSRPKPF